MFIHFTFKDGSNPYIATVKKSLLYMLIHYDCEQTGENMFLVHGRSQWLGIGQNHNNYQRTKRRIRYIAIEWQYSSYKFNYSFSHLLEWQDFFGHYGKKYGLFKEFRENGIC